MLEGLKLGGRNGHMKMILFSDCQDAIRAINEDEHFFNRDGYILEKVIEGLRNLADWRCEHVHRDLNKAAYFLAKLPSTPTDPLNWIELKVKEWVPEL